MVALIDADIVAYRAASVAQENIDWNDGVEGNTLSSQQAKESAQHIINEWMHGARQNRAILCWSSTNNFRKEISDTYKTNRGGEKPELLLEVTEWMKSNHESYSVEGLEADDVMGIYHTTSGTDSVIVSIDKDMQTIPGMVFNPDKDRGPKRISIGQADRFWMLQTLMGDRVDGIKGIPRIGPKKAEKILAETHSVLAALWATVVSAYNNAGLNERDAIATARLTRILRSEDYNRDKQEIRLWHPFKTDITLSLTTAGTDAIPSISSKAKVSDSTKETSSNTSADGDVKEDSKTSRKQGSTSTDSLRRRRFVKKKKKLTTQGR